MENNTWFYIQSNKTGHVISASRQIRSEHLDPKRSQVYVYPPLQTDDELWTYERQYIRNKATGLVLDIRKGRLRLIEDTEICLYDEKPLEEASNQLWGIRDTSQGKLIYSISNTDWSLTQDENKLLLYPHEPLQSTIQQHDTWEWIAEHSFIPSLSTSTTTAAATATAEWSGPTTPGLCSSVGSSVESSDFSQGGLSPAKRGSQGSVNLYSMETFKDYHDRLYQEKDTHLSDKALSMAAAYHSWISVRPMDSIKELDEPGRIQLQNKAEQEAQNLLLSNQHQDHHKETVLHLTLRFINLLMDQKVSTS
ncbi:uncharacterized protein BX664DRAFT_338487 [Halteromyces radiatus]|uniref:uncharacterized protein n=1 Tax=Halteromyces radiatus TaxID=101107 RepID=UPI0022200DF5|nr:uncharacterized protein BX664DRAFT_338487 [Halteromyces radiatus]KAI8085082.1 hypothetical protein BX664DRAFT_338487 [Halteromyces radiatus]